MEWISVEEEGFPPDEGQKQYLVSTAEGIFIDEWILHHESPVSFSTATISTDWGFSEHDHDDVAHWMPLPEPPGNSD